MRRSNFLPQERAHELRQMRVSVYWYSYLNNVVKYNRLHVNEYIVYVR